LYRRDAINKLEAETKNVMITAGRSFHNNKMEEPHPALGISDGSVEQLVCNTTTTAGTHSSITIGPDSLGSTSTPFTSATLHGSADNSHI
jgi:hypothetical protein